MNKKINDFNAIMGCEITSKKALMEAYRHRDLLQDTFFDVKKHYKDKISGMETRKKAVVLEMQMVVSMLFRAQEALEEKIARYCGNDTDAV